jgi:hypothetical protein
METVLSYICSGGGTNATDSKGRETEKVRSSIAVRTVIRGTRMPMLEAGEQME